MSIVVTILHNLYYITFPDKCKLFSLKFKEKTSFGRRESQELLKLDRDGKGMVNYKVKNRKKGRKSYDATKEKQPVLAFPGDFQSGRPGGLGG